jgi:hypothetical protein
MEKTFCYTCACCGEEQEGAPSMAFKAPDSCFAIPESERGDETRLDADFCMVERRDYFIRCTIDIPIHDCDAPFMWGVWLCVAYEDFMEYWQHFDEHDRPGRYAGWLGNRLAVYPDTIGLEGSAVLQPRGKRPLIELKPTEHPLSIDYRHGISWERAVEIAEVALPGHNT